MSHSHISFGLMLFAIAGAVAANKLGFRIGNYIVNKLEKWFDNTPVDK